MVERGEFSLLREPWISVMNEDCSVEDVSLLTLFERAHTYLKLSGETPTQDVAILRLLLAILHAVFERRDVSGNADPVRDLEQALTRWQSLWKLGRFPSEVIANYLDGYDDRFYLFHDEYPFYQAPPASVGTAHTAAKLNGEISESNNKIRLFSSRAGETKNALSYAETARWLLHVNGFDDTASKAKGKGEDDKKLPASGVGWLGRLGLIVAVGNNLFETLTLNLTMLQDGKTNWEPERPVWENETVKSAERTEIRIPRNQSELLTLQSRRLMLQRTGELVTGFNLLGGDFFPKENAFEEQFTMWRKLKDQKGVQGDFVPRPHDLNKQLWRSFSYLAQRSENSRVPGVIEWLSLLERKKLIARNHKITFMIASAQYGDKYFFISDIFSDSLEFSVKLLTDIDEGRWVGGIVDEIKICDRIAERVKYLASDLAKAAGGSPQSADDEADSAQAQYYYRIDLPFREWLGGIDPERTSDIDSSADYLESARLEWRKRALDIARKLGGELVDEAGEGAFVGRKIKEKNKKTRVEEERTYTSPGAYNRFIAGLKKLENGG